MAPSSLSGADGQEPTTADAVAEADAPPPAPAASRVRIKLDVSGEIFAPAGPDKPQIREPISVDARFDFVESVAGDAPEGGALRHYADGGISARFVSNVDPADLVAKLDGLDPATSGAMLDIILDPSCAWTVVAAVEIHPPPDASLLKPEVMLSNWSSVT